MATSTRTPWFAWPFVALWRLLTGILALTGRLIGVVLGFVLLIVGFVLSATVIGAVIGVPLMIFAVLLITRGLF